MSDVIAQSLVGLLILLFVGFGVMLLLLKTGKGLLRRLLGSFFIVFGLVILDVYAQISGFYTVHPALAYWLAWLALLFGPLIYLITKASLYEHYRLTRRDWLHFLPAFAIMLFSALGYHFQSGEVREEFLQRSRQVDAWYNLAVSLFVLGTMAAYLVAALRLLAGYRRELPRQFSSLEQKRLTWLSRLIYGFAGVVGISLLIQLTAYSTANRAWIVGSCMVMVAMLLGMIFFNVYRGLRESELFAGIARAEPGPQPPLAGVDTELQARITDYLRTERSYLEPDLTLAGLARRTATKPRELSAAINNGMADNFFDLINRYRIEHAKRLLAGSQDKKITVLEVMYAAGFNSKSSFNTAFKKATGQTPSQWKSQCTVNQ